MWSTLDMTTKGRRTLAVVASLTLALASCGDSNAEGPSAVGIAKAEIAKVVGQLQAASVAGDGTQICNDIFTPKLADSVTAAASSGSCATEVKANLFSPRTTLKVQDVEVTDGSNAVATVEEENGKLSKVFFARQSGIWRIRSVQPD